MNVKLYNKGRMQENRTEEIDIVSTHIMQTQFNLRIWHGFRTIWLTESWDRLDAEIKTYYV